MIKTADPWHEEGHPLWMPSSPGLILRISASSDSSFILNQVWIEAQEENLLLFSCLHCRSEPPQHCSCLWRWFPLRSRWIPCFLVWWSRHPEQLQQGRLRRQRWLWSEWRHKQALSSFCWCNSIWSWSLQSLIRKWLQISYADQLLKYGIQKAVITTLMGILISMEA